MAYKFEEFYGKYVGNLQQGSGAQYSGRCPLHADHRASFSVNLESGLWSCHAGCGSGNAETFLIKIKEVEKEIDAPPASYGKARIVVASYDYKDETGKLLYQVQRYNPKGFSQRRPDANGGWVYNLHDVRRVLYLLPELVKWAADDTVFIVEGEKDADNLRKNGLLATCNPGGAGKWRAEYNQYLVGRSVVIIPDNDEAGRTHAEQVAEALQTVASSVKMLVLPGLPIKGDVSDWLEQGHSKAELLSLVQKTEIRRSVSLHLKSTWPLPIQASAFHGLAGDFVRMVEPHSEADPVALLTQFLVAFGNIIGRGPHFRAEADRHYTNLFVVLVGDTAKGRKGSAWGHVLGHMGFFDDAWAAQCVLSGLSSGEGLVHAVRDEGGTEAVGRGRRPAISDIGVSDKRLLAFEPEFASLLRVMEREGNTLSAQLRQAWDSGHLRIITKNSPAKSTNAHISIVGHVTKEELLRYLNRTESANGFANRFLWVCCKRSKCLPEGGAIPSQESTEFKRKLDKVIATARRHPEEIRKDQEATVLWANVYPRLSEGQAGLFGAITSRAEAQTMRLAVLFALLDCSTQIKRIHLEAALAVWQYAEDSSRYIFGGNPGVALEEEMKAIISDNPTGLPKHELSRRLVGNHKTTRVNEALRSLESKGVVHRQQLMTKGRASELWCAGAGAKEVTI